MRKAILVIVLVAASFLGGAFVNGPGLQWAQTRLLRSFGSSNGGEIASVDLEGTGSPETISGGSGPAKVVAEMTQSPLSSLAAEDDSSEEDASDHHSPSQFKSKSKYDGPGPSEFQLPTPSSPSSTKVARALAKKPAGAGAPSDPQVTPASSASPLSASRVPAISSPQVTPAILDSLAALLPSTPPVSGSPSPSSSPPRSAPKPVRDGGDEWAVLESKMQTLGVSRFTIEGKPGGRVVFACLIPLAGRQAVTQRFEAEGDDMAQAAHAALRRIGLWRATQAVSK